MTPDTKLMDRGLDRERDRGQRLSAAMGVGSSYAFQAFEALPSNFRAIESALQFASGHVPFVAVYGPSGWGKTHLLEAVTSLLRRSSQGDVRPRQALEWVGQIRRVDPPGQLVLDDVQDVISRPKSRHEFRQAIELRVRTGRPTLLSFTGFDDAKALKALLPSSRSWTYARISPPTPEERELVVRRIAEQAGLTMNPSLAKMIARHLHGNGRSIAGALQRLQLLKREWSSDADVVRACGALGPYLIGEDGWDPRDKVFETVSREIGSDGARDIVTDMCCYLMLFDMGLSETEVATFVTGTEGEVYARASRVKRSLKDPVQLQMVNTCRNAVLRAFQQE